MNMTLRFADAACRSWTALYTLGLDEVTRERRRAEIESDLWEQRSHSQEEGPDLGFDIIARVVLGMAADVTWRVQSGGRITAPGTRTQGVKPMLNKLFVSLTSVVTIFSGVFFIYVALGRTSDGAEGFAAPLLGAGLALTGGGLAAFWSPRIGTSLVAAGALLMVFMFPWMAGATLPLALVLIVGTLARGRAERAAPEADSDLAKTS